MKTFILKENFFSNNFFANVFVVFLKIDFKFFWEFFAVFATISDTGSGGNTDRHHDVLYLCLMSCLF